MDWDRLKRLRLSCAGGMGFSSYNATNVTVQVTKR